MDLSSSLAILFLLITLKTMASDSILLEDPEREPTHGGGKDGRAGGGGGEDPGDRGGATPGDAGVGGVVAVLKPWVAKPRIRRQAISTPRMTAGGNTTRPQNQSLSGKGESSTTTNSSEDTTEEMESSLLLAEDEQRGPSLGFILGVATLVVLVLYIIGISIKLIKMHQGTYVEEEPIFLKYK